jgi:hypothetical protein
MQISRLKPNGEFYEANHSFAGGRPHGGARRFSQDVQISLADGV